MRAIVTRALLRQSRLLASDRYNHQMIGSYTCGDIGSDIFNGRDALG
jgi:hypothetical protein